MFGALELIKYAILRSKNSLFPNEAKCKTFFVKLSFIYMKIKNIFISMASHLVSNWNRGLEQFGNRNFFREAWPPSHFSIIIIERELYSTPLDR